MIGSLRGRLLSKKPPILCIEIAGVGYEVFSPLSTFYHLPEINEEVFLHTHLVVREDAHILYGFFKEQERSLFRSLIKVSNVGPKLALTILSGIEVDAFVKCVMEHNIQALVGLPGVGKKTAERLMIEMKDKLTDWHEEFTVVELQKDKRNTSQNFMMQDAVSALIALGFKPAEASRAIAQVKENYTSCEELIKFALQNTCRA